MKSLNAEEMIYLFSKLLQTSVKIMCFSDCVDYFIPTHSTKREMELAQRHLRLFIHDTTQYIMSFSSE